MQGVSLRQIEAARVLLGWSPAQLAAAAGLEADGLASLSGSSSIAPIVRVVLENAGIQFLGEDGGGPGVRLRHAPGPRDEGLRPDQLNSENDG
jgi:hypothetical protein